jgi:hypothetical protein
MGAGVNDSVVAGFELPDWSAPKLELLEMVPMMYSTEFRV